jgi:hypothetical protein
MMHALAEAAANDLATAIIAGDTDELRELTKAAVGSMAAYIIACTEHDASRHNPPVEGL